MKDKRMNAISAVFVALAMTLALFKNTCASTSEENTAVGSTAVSRFTCGQKAFLSELKIPEDFDTFSTPISTALEAEINIVGNEILRGVFENRVYRGDDGSLYLLIEFIRGSASFNISKWRENPREFAEQKQHFSSLFS